jgi:ethanolamine ammonia-lyase small subunit
MTQPPTTPPGSTAELWARLRAATPARIGLACAGDAQTTEALLDFQLAHAQARAAIHRGVDFSVLAGRLALAGRLPLPTRHVHSAAPDRATYIRRPDYGRRLNDASRALLAADRADPPWDLVLIIADGLSCAAVEDHAVPFLHAARQAFEGLRVAPLILAEQARVALSDDIGATLNANLAVMLIGERPGLSVRNSLGIYLTFDPKPGRTDGERNCLSNIHAEGLSYALAAEKLAWLIHESRRRQGSGVFLKEDAAGMLTAAFPKQELLF